MGTDLFFHYSSCLPPLVIFPCGIVWQCYSNREGNNARLDLGKKNKKSLNPHRHRGFRLFLLLVRGRGVEPLCPKASDPKSGASTSFATLARLYHYNRTASAQDRHNCRVECPIWGKSSSPKPRQECNTSHPFTRQDRPQKEKGPKPIIRIIIIGLWS